MKHSQTPLRQHLADVDIRLVRVFCGVVRCGGMAAAELDLNIGRSTISRHMKDLEERLGATLCHRGRGGFSLTPEGRQVYQAAQRMLVALDQFQGEVSALHTGMTGQLTLALFDKTVTNDASKVHEAIASFHQLAPEVHIDIHVEPVNEIERRVIDGTYQLGIIPTHRQSASLRYQLLFREQMYLYCGDQHPLFDQADRADKDSILACAYAGMGFHSPNMEVGSQLGWQRRASAYDQEGIAVLIRSGCYVGFLPAHYAEHFVRRDQMRRLGGMPAGGPFQYNCDFAAISRQSPKPGRVLAAFLDCLSASHGAAAQHGGNISP